MKKEIYKKWRQQKNTDRCIEDKIKENFYE